MAETLEALEEWEEYDPDSGISFFSHALAGSLAGAAEHCVMFPVDTIKTHMQASTSNKQRPLEVARSLLSEKSGGKRMWRGVSTMLYGCVPAHAAYFSIFEQSKKTFGADSESHTPLAAALSGALSTIAHDAVMTPMDCVKQRLQLGFYEGTFNCFQTVLRTEGVGALYLSFPTTLVMNIPFASVMVAINESAKKVLNPNNEYSVKAFVISGGLAGGVAAFVTNPLDVVKTRLQTQNLLTSYPNCTNISDSSGLKPVIEGRKVRRGVGLSILKGYISHPLGTSVRASYTLKEATLKKCGCSGDVPLKYSSFTSTVAKIYSEEGVKGFSRGALSRVFVHAPSVAISWTTYETAKKVLQF